MPQFTLDKNVDGFDILKLPLKITTSRAGGIRIDKVYVENITNFVSRHVFKIRDIYCDYSNVSNFNPYVENVDFFSQLVPYPLNRTDFHVEHKFSIIEDDFFDFAVTFEPISNATVTGDFSSKIIIEYTHIDNSVTDNFFIIVSAECREQRVSIIDGVSTKDNTYELKVHNLSYSNEFIRLG